MILPFAWLKILWLILNDEYYEKFEKKSFLIATRFIHGILWVFLGVFFLLIKIFEKDVLNFYKSAYDEVIMPKKKIPVFQQQIQKYISLVLESEEALGNDQTESEEKSLYLSLQQKIIKKIENNHSLPKTYRDNFVENEKFARVSGLFYEEIKKYFGFSLPQKKEKINKILSETPKN